MPTTIKESIRPPLKWAGGKRWLVPHLKPIWEEHAHRRLVEPLCGGLAITLGLLPDKALLNDVNVHVVNFYQWLKRGLTVDIDLKNDRANFYQNRSRFNELILNGQADSREAAALFYYLNRTCYNGLCRFNRKGEFNVPFGKHKTINYETDFTSYRDIFVHWKFTCGDFVRMPLEDSDFIYADPPYDVQFRQYSKDGFEWDDQVRLTEWLAQHKGPVALSNQATDRIIKLYKKLGFDLEYYDAPRMINSTGDRTPAREVLALKNV